MSATSFRAPAMALLQGHDLDPDNVASLKAAIEHMAEALSEENSLTATGIERVLRYVASHLHRLSLLTLDRRRYPEIAAVKVAPPVVITGAPRSGSTFLHSLMAQDPQHRSPLAWEVEFPSPPPQAADLLSDPRIEAWRELQNSPAAVHSKSLRNSELVMKHLMGPTLPEECGSLLGTLLRNPTGVWSLARAPQYFNWIVASQMDEAYAIHRKWLQHLQWRAPRPHWLLKYPQHILALGSLLRAYPDAMIIQTHRRPDETISSVASLIGTLRRGALAEEDNAALGEEMLQLQATAMDCAIEYRDGAGAREIVDVGYPALMADPLGSVAGIYERLGLTLSAEAEQKMANFLAENPQNKHGVHRHDLDQFGLSAERVRERMASYFRRFEALL